MWKRFLDGLIFGSGFGIAFVVVWIASMYFVLPSVFEHKINSKQEASSSNETYTVPLVGEPKTFLGSTGVFSGEFSHDKSKVLAEGPGQIIGSVSANGAPVAGLKLQLALNGSVMSQWVTTDAAGQYIVHVPFGKYRIDGFELDYSTANKVLPDKIGHPQSPHSSDTFEVSKESAGHGLDFKFVDPIMKSMKRKKYAATEEVILEWVPYPNAVEYQLQIYEKDDPYSWSNKTLFKWSERPEVNEPSLNLKKLGVQFKPGKFYEFEVHARDQQNRMLSETARTHSGYDFEIEQ